MHTPASWGFLLALQFSFDFKKEIITLGFSK